MRNLKNPESISIVVLFTGFHIFQTSNAYLLQSRQRPSLMELYRNFVLETREHSAVPPQRSSEFNRMRSEVLKSSIDKQKRVIFNFILMKSMN